MRRAGRPTGLTLAGIAAVSAAGAASLLLLVGFLLWEHLGYREGEALMNLLAAVLALPLLALPGVVVVLVAGCRGWWLGLGAVLSALLAVGGALVAEVVIPGRSGPLGLWAGMVLGSLLAVLVAGRLGRSVHPPHPLRL